MRTTVKRWLPLIAGIAIAACGNGNGGGARTAVEPPSTDGDLALGRQEPAPDVNGPPGRVTCDGRVLAVTVALGSPGIALAGVLVQLTYPAGLVLPGALDDPEVEERVIFHPSIDGLLVSQEEDLPVDESLLGGFFAVNDQDHLLPNAGLTFALVTIRPFTTGPLATIDFDCVRAMAVAPVDFPCAITSAATELGAPIDGLTCEVVRLGGTDRTY